MRPTETLVGFEKGAELFSFTSSHETLVGLEEQGAALLSFTSSHETLVGLEEQGAELLLYKQP